METLILRTHGVLSIPQDSCASRRTLFSLASRLFFHQILITIFNNLMVQISVGNGNDQLDSFFKEIFFKNFPKNYFY